MLPGSITIREVRFRVEQAGFRTRSIVVVTTRLDPAQACRAGLDEQYRARWNNEVYKQTAPQDSACVRPEGRPIVGVTALLELARWGRRRRHDIPGQSPCNATTIDQSPPACSQPGTPGPPEPALGGIAGPSPARRARRAQPNGGPAAADASSEAGGVA